MQLVGQRVPRSQLQEIATLFHTVCWEFPDYRFKSYFTLNGEGEVRGYSQWNGPVDGTVIMDARTFHDAAFGKTSFGAAFLMGKVRVKGIPATKLGKFMPLLQPFLDCYQQACEEEIHGPST